MPACSISRRVLVWVAAVLTLLAGPIAVSAAATTAEPIRIASKNFNESYLLSEMLAQLLEARGYSVERRFGLGGTLICYDALVNDEIDLYVEYTGTLSQAVLKLGADAERETLNAKLRAVDLTLLEPFGFNNTYALVLKQQLAADRSLSRISDLRDVPDLKVLVSHEFHERQDGWPGLAQRYGLTQEVGGIEHGLAYQALADGSLDITDAYSTDGELERYNLTVLEDDLGFFPRYFAAPLVRSNLSPQVKEILSSLAASIDDKEMQRLNAQVVFNKRSFAAVSAEHLQMLGLVDPAAQSKSAVRPGWVDQLIKNTLQHLKLTAIALGLAVVFGLGLSLFVYSRPTLSKIALYLCSLMQTVPSIALLALMIPLLGIGQVPAIVALFLYSLLPIVRNTVMALTTVDPVLVRAGTAMGLSANERLRHVYLPLSLPSIFAGVRTAAVISIGTATLAAFIGAGGLGDPIVTGLALNDSNLILQGALPAAGLAILTELLFEAIERAVLPSHLRGAAE